MLLASDWAGTQSPQGFLYEQVRRLRNPNHASTVYEGANVPAVDFGAYMVNVTKVGDRIRYELHGPADLAIVEPLRDAPHAYDNAAAWADEFEHRPERFKVHALRRIFGGSNGSAAVGHVAPQLPVDSYYVHETSINGRTRYELREVAAESNNIFD